MPSSPDHFHHPSKIPCCLIFSPRQSLIWCLVSLHSPFLDVLYKPRYTTGGFVWALVLNLSVHLNPTGSISKTWVHGNRPGKILIQLIWDGPEQQSLESSQGILMCSPGPPFSTSIPHTSLPMTMWLLPQKQSSICPNPTPALPLVSAQFRASSLSVWPVAPASFCLPTRLQLMAEVTFLELSHNHTIPSFKILWWLPGFVQSSPLIGLAPFSLWPQARDISPMNPPQPSVTSFIFLLLNLEDLLF